MNGDVLKKVFLIIVITLCVIAFGLTLAVLMGKFPIESYEKVMEILGIPTLLGMIVTSFIHANIKDAPPDESSKITTTEVSKNVQSNNAVLQQPAQQDSGKQASSGV